MITHFCQFRSLRSLATRFAKFVGYGRFMLLYSVGLLSMPNVKRRLPSMWTGIAAGCGIIFLVVLPIISIGAPLGDFFMSPTAGAAAVCNIVNSDRGIISEDSQATSCRLTGESVASAALPTAQVKVYAASTQWAQQDYLTAGSTAALMDLITVTDGWDANGEASGTFEMAVKGSMDDSSPDYSGYAHLQVYVWNHECLDFSCDADSYRGFGDTLAAVNPQLSDGPLLSQDRFYIAKDERGTGRVVVQSGSAADLRVELSVQWTVTKENPSFYVLAYAQAGMIGGTPGTIDFFDSGQTLLRGPEGFKYTSTNGYGSGFNAPPLSDTAVDLGGTVQTRSGIQICAIVLASGKYTFSCGPYGAFSLNDLPRDGEGTVTRQVYAAGFLPKIEKLVGSVDETVVLQPAIHCPDYNSYPTPETYPGSAGRWITVSGRVLARQSDKPVCALVLANGSHVFSCDGTGSFDLEFPLDDNGQYALQVYADGFAPVIQTFDEFSIPGDVRTARASECR